MNRADELLTREQLDNLDEMAGLVAAQGPLLRQLVKMARAALNEKPHEPLADNGFRMALNIRCLHERTDGWRCLDCGRLVELPASPSHAAAERCEHGVRWQDSCRACAAAEPEKPTNDSQLADNGRVGTTQGSDETRTHIPRSAHPSQAATPLLTTGPSQEGAAGSAATPTAMRVALESHAEPEKPVAWMYQCASHAEVGDAPSVTTQRWSGALGNWTETPLYASPAEPKGPMNDAEQMLCESIMNKHVTAGPVSVIPVRAAVFAAYQAGKAAVRQPIAREPNKMEMLAARLTAPPFCETCRDMREEVAGQLYDMGD